jgi:hypothetical protein
VPTAKNFFSRIIVPRDNRDPKVEIYPILRKQFQKRENIGAG